MEAMPRPRPPHLHRETNRHGKTVWYVRFGKSRRVRINATFGSAEFDDAYQAALSDQKPQQAGKAARGTLGWLWALYRGSTAWLDLSMATRKQRENIMLHVLKSGGGRTTFTDRPASNSKRPRTPRGHTVAGQEFHQHDARAFQLGG